MKLSRPYLIIILILAISSQYAFAKRGAKVEMWKRFEISIENSLWQGNPFDVIFEATFTSPSGRDLTQIGFYAGVNTWKIYFMPNEKGKWTYQIHSDHANLDGKSGGFTCIKSNIQAPIVTDGRQWRIQDGDGVFPVIWAPTYPDGKHYGFRANGASDPNVQEAIRFADEVVGARYLGIGELGIALVDWAKDWPQSAVPYIKGKEGDEFNIPFWDYLNERMDAARDRNMGAYIMLYGDDAMNPNNFGITPRSEKEIRFFRYVIARLACYPNILWDSGIDIGEYRNNEWINWYTSWFLEHDAWKHPVGSRSGGGSGGIMPDKGTYYSLGGASLPGRSELLKNYEQSEVPIANTDHWRPFISRGNWDIKKLKVAMWRCGLSGAQALYPDFNQGEIQFDIVEQGAQIIGIATNFFKNELRYDLLKLNPHDELLVEGNNAILSANPGREYIVYDEDGGSFSVDFSATKESFFAKWYNPNTGEMLPIGKIKGGKTRSFKSPSNGIDWILHVYLN